MHDDPLPWLTRRCASLIVMLCALRAGAEPDAPKEHEYKDGHRVWTLLGYMHGTAPEIRQAMVKETVRLAAMLKSTREQSDEATRKYDAARADALKKLDADDGFKRLASELAAAEKARDDAKNGGAPDERLSTATGYMKAKSAVENKRRELVDNSPAVAQARKAMDQARQSLHLLETSIGSQEIWRRDIIDAMRGSASISWPAEVGSSGILGKITPLKKLADGSFEANYLADEIVDVKEQREGIATVSVFMHPVKVVVSEFAQPFEVGKPMNCDQVFEVSRQSTEAESEKPTWWLAPAKASDLGELLAAVTPPPPDVPADELERFVKLAEHKEHARTWTTPQTIFDAMPADIRPRREPGDAERVQRQNDWLKRELIGDNLDATLRIRSASEIPEGMVIRAQLESGGEAGKVHRFTLLCPPAMKSKASQMRIGQQIHAVGVIRSIGIEEDGTLQVKLVEASF